MMSFAKILPIPSATMEVNGGFTNGVSDEGNVNGSTATNNGQVGSKVMSGRRRFGENGFEEQGGYMAAKKAKLDFQFNSSTRVFGADSGTNDNPGIFKGLSIYINGYTSPPEPELKELFIRHGGTFHPYNNIKTTYVIATNLSVPSKRLHAAKTIKPEWILESISAGKALDSRNYMLYDLNKEKNQSTLTQFMGMKPPLQNGNSGPIIKPSTEGTELPIAPEEVVGTTNDDDTIDRVLDSDEELFESSQVEDPTTKIPPVNGLNQVEANEEPINELVDKENFSEDNPPPPETINGHHDPSIFENACNALPLSPIKAGKIRTATDDGFMEEFFGRSRLHLISEQKKEMQMYITNLRKNKDSQTFPNLARFSAEVELKGCFNGLRHWDNEVVLMHIDLDCFFVSVGLLSRPHLRGKPVVVTHSTGKGKESKSDIACASYEARLYGVRNGSWVGNAKALCPELEVIPYDFEEYRRVSKTFFDAVASVTLNIEPCSVDEMIVDITPILSNVPGSTPEHLAQFLREIILEETKCPASIGIGSNRLLAKLAVKMAKPDGIYFLKDCDASVYIQSLHVRDLPGIGYSNEGKLKDLYEVETCADLLNVPLRELKGSFGDKTAEKMHNLCKGIDSSEIKLSFERPKSISVDVNFGIRFSKEDDVTTFLINICKELSSRAERIQAVSTHFTLKLLIRKKGAGEPLKQGGHGIVDSLTRSRSLLTPTRNWQDLYKTACSLVRLVRIPPTDFRGVGVTLTDLTFDCDKPNKKSVQRTLTDMPISRAQKMLSISKKKHKGTSVETETQSSHTLATMGNDIPPLDEIGNNEEVSAIFAQGVQEDVPTKQVRFDTVSVQTLEASITDNLPVDISVLRALPRDIAEEQCNFYGISKDLLDEDDNFAAFQEVPASVDETIENVIKESAKEETSKNNAELAKYYDNVDVDRVDQSFLLALPESVRQDVLIQLQEAKGRRQVNDVTATKFDEQQPCSSRQAMERDKRIQELRNEEDNLIINVEQINVDEILEVSSQDDESSPLDNQPVDQRETPIINYNGKSSKLNIDPKEFWDMSVDMCLLPPKPVTFPALNNSSDVREVRDMIRNAIETVNDPTVREIEHLEKYFSELIARGCIQQTQVLLRFLQRKSTELDESSFWTPVLTKIIQDTQETCRQLYHGELELE